MLMGVVQVVKLDPSSPLGYERKHEAFRGIGRHVDAIKNFDKMLLKMSDSSDPGIRGEDHDVIQMFIC